MDRNGNCQGNGREGVVAPFWHAGVCPAVAVAGKNRTSARCFGWEEWQYQQRRTRQTGYLHLSRRHGEHRLCTPRLLRHAERPQRISREWKGRDVAGLCSQAASAIRVRLYESRRYQRTSKCGAGNSASHFGDAGIRLR